MKKKKDSKDKTFCDYLNKFERSLKASLIKDYATVSGTLAPRLVEKARLQK